MTEADQHHDPESFLAAAAALRAINEAVHTGGPARTPGSAPPPGPPQGGSEQALSALLMLRELREQLAGWEPELIESARAAGASWADLAHPLGVASRQAAERRYLRVRPGPPGSTGEERVQATRSRRAANRSVTAWARGNAADLRRTAGQVTALTDLPADAEAPLVRLTEALGANDAAELIGPLADLHAYVHPGHPDLAARIDTLSRHAEHLREGGDGAGP